MVVLFDEFVMVIVLGFNVFFSYFVNLFKVNCVFVIIICGIVIGNLCLIMSVI